jgi:excisionase family DNA binding protein
MSAVTAVEVAAELGCSVDKVYRMARFNEIPAMRVGRSWRFDLEAVKTKLTTRPVEVSWEQSRRSTARRRVA